MKPRKSSRLVAVLLGVLSGGVGCGSSSGPNDSSDAGSCNASTEAAAPYNGPFNVPAGTPVTIPLTGCAGPGYAAQFTVGSGTFQLIIDTGSGDVAVASNTCTNCGVSPVYTPDGGALNMNASDSFALGSWTGQIYSSSVTLVGQGTPVNMDVAAIDSQSGFFGDAGCGFGTIPFAPEGIVGFGPSDLATQGASNFLTALTASGTVPNLFAVELCPGGGQFMVGGVDPAKAKLSGPAQYTALLSSTDYDVTLSDVKLSGVSTGYDASALGTTVVDTGTSVLALPPAVFNGIVSKIESQPAFLTAFGKGGWFGTTTCLTSTLCGAQLDAELPTLTLSFPDMAGGTLSLTLKATESYLPPTTKTTSSGATTYYCSGIYEGAQGQTILGAAAMLGHLVIFDVADGKLGFAPQTYCP